MNEEDVKSIVYPDLYSTYEKRYQEVYDEIGKLNVQLTDLHDIHGDKNGYDAIQSTIQEKYALLELLGNLMAYAYSGEVYSLKASDVEEAKRILDSKETVTEEKREWASLITDYSELLRKQGVEATEYNTLPNNQEVVADHGEEIPVIDGQRATTEESIVSNEDLDRAFGVMSNPGTATKEEIEWAKGIIDYAERFTKPENEMSVRDHFGNEYAPASLKGAPTENDSVFNSEVDLAQVYTELLDLKKKLKTSSGENFEKLRKKYDRLSLQMEQMLGQQNNDVQEYYRAIADLDDQIERLRKAITKRSLDYYNSFIRIRGIMGEQAENSYSQMDDLEFQAEVDRLINANTNENNVAQNLREEINKQNALLNSLLKQKRLFELAQSIHLTPEEYKELMTKEGAAELLRSIIVMAGFEQILSTPYQLRTSEQRRQLIEQHDAFIAEFRRLSSVLDNPSILDSVEAVHKETVPEKVREEGTPRALIINGDIIFNITFNLGNMPERIVGRDESDVSKEPGKAPEDMKDAMESRNPQLVSNPAVTPTVPSGDGETTPGNDSEKDEYVEVARGKMPEDRTTRTEEQQLEWALRDAGIDLSERDNYRVELAPAHYDEAASDVLFNDYILYRRDDTKKTVGETTIVPDETMLDNKPQINGINNDANPIKELNERMDLSMAINELSSLDSSANTKPLSEMSFAELRQQLDTLSTRVTEFESAIVLIEARFGRNSYVAELLNSTRRQLLERMRNIAEEMSVAMVRENLIEENGRVYSREVVFKGRMPQDRTTRTEEQRLEWALREAGINPSERDDYRIELGPAYYDEAASDTLFNDYSLVRVRDLQRKPDGVKTPDDAYEYVEVSKGKMPQDRTTRTEEQQLEWALRDAGINLDDRDAYRIELGPAYYDEAASDTLFNDYVLYRRVKAKSKVKKPGEVPIRPGEDELDEPQNTPIPGPRGGSQDDQHVNPTPRPGDDDQHSIPPVGPGDDDQHSIPPVGPGDDDQHSIPPVGPGDDDQDESERKRTERIYLYIDLDNNGQRYLPDEILQQLHITVTTPIVNIEGVDTRAIDDDIYSQFETLVNLINDVDYRIIPKFVHLGRDLDHDHDHDDDDDDTLEEIVIYRDRESGRLFMTDEHLSKAAQTSQAPITTFISDGETIEAREIDEDTRLDVEQTVNQVDNPAYRITYKDIELEKEKDEEVITIYRDVEDNNQLYLSSANLLRFGIDFDESEVGQSIDGELCFKIDSEKEEELKAKAAESEDPKYRIEYKDVHLEKKREEVITIYRDVENNNQLYVSSANLLRFGIDFDASEVGQSIDGELCFKIDSEKEEELKAKAAESENPKYRIEYKDVHLEKKKPKRHYQTIIQDLTKDLYIKKNDGKRYQASNIKVWKSFWDELHSGNVLYNIVHFIPGVVKAGFNFIRKLTSKLLLSKRGKTGMQELENRFDNLSDEDKETLLKDYKGHNALQDMNTQINPVLLLKIKEYALQKIARMNAEIEQSFHTLLAILGEIDALDRQLQAGPNEQALATRRSLMQQAGELCLHINKLRSDADELLSSGIHGLEEDFKAVATKLNYVGKRFAKGHNFNNELQEQLARYGQGMLDAEADNNYEGIVDNFMKYESIYSENTSIKGSIFGRRSVGEKYYTPLATVLDYRNDPFLSDLFTSIAIVATTVGTIKALDYNRQVQAANQANAQTINQVKGDAARIEGHRGEFAEGSEAVTQITNNSHAGTLERGALDGAAVDYGSWGKGYGTPEYKALDEAAHSTYNQLNSNINSELTQIAADKAAGLINDAQAFQRLTQLSDSAYANLQTVCQNGLNTIRTYQAAHPGIDVSAFENSMAYIAGHPMAITNMNGAMLDTLNIANGLTHIQAVNILGSDWGAIMGAISAATIAHNVCSRMSNGMRHGKYGNSITEAMDEYRQSGAGSFTQTDHSTPRGNDDDYEDEDSYDDVEPAEFGGRGR